jgi:hypothetical protein
MGHRLAYVEQILVPTLRKGDTIFMDNLRTHKIRTTVFCSVDFTMGPTRDGAGIQHADLEVGNEVEYFDMAKRIPGISARTP